MTKIATAAIDVVMIKAFKEILEEYPDDLYAGIKLKYYQDADTARANNVNDPVWQKNNLEYDLRSTAWICNKAKSSKVYAQHLYAALCNQDFQKLDAWEILSGNTWGCSWRHAGGILADMLETGSYTDWYCSSFEAGQYIENDTNTVDPQHQAAYEQALQFVTEGIVTDEIRADLKTLSWIVVTPEGTK